MQVLLTLPPPIGRRPGTWDNSARTSLSTDDLEMSLVELKEEGLGPAPYDRGRGWSRRRGPASAAPQADPAEWWTQGSWASRRAS